MTKVLFFVDRLRHGGIQQLILEILKHINKEILQIDVLVFDDGETYPLEDEIKKLGVNLFKIDGWIKTPLSYLKQKKVLDEFYKEHHDYKAVHLHSSSKNFFVLKEAKKYGIPIRIAHSHNIGFQTKNKIKIFVGNILKNALIKNATDYFACSKLAGKWLFGDDIVNSNKFKVIHNAVEYDKFKFNEQIREQLRNEIEIDDKCILFGNVGRFTNQKNHTFLIDIFKELSILNEKCHLYLIGDGELRGIIEDKVKKLDLYNKVHFLGVRNDVNNIMQAMDMFLLPSNYEGLPVVGIEAQAAGLPVICSTEVTDEICITNNVKMISLNEQPRYWAMKVCEVLENFNRVDTKKIIEQNKFDIKSTVNMLYDIYI